MLSHVLALAVGLGSFTFYLAAFFFPEVHRKSDFIWSGVGLFYALVLWVCAERITGGVLLGQTASVSLLLWLGWQTLSLRRSKTPETEQTEISPEVKKTIKGFNPNQLLDSLKNRFSKPKTPTQQTIEDIGEAKLEDKLEETPSSSVSQPVADGEGAENQQTQPEQPLENAPSSQEPEITKDIQEPPLDKIEEQLAEEIPSEEKSEVIEDSPQPPLKETPNAEKSEIVPPPAPIAEISEESVEKSVDEPVDGPVDEPVKDIKPVDNTPTPQEPKALEEQPEPPLDDTPTDTPTDTPKPQEPKVLEEQQEPPVDDTLTPQEPVKDTLEKTIEFNVEDIQEEETSLSPEILETIGKSKYNPVELPEEKADESQKKDSEGTIESLENLPPSKPEVSPPAKPQATNLLQTLQGLKKSNEPPSQDEGELAQIESKTEEEPIDRKPTMKESIPKSSNPFEALMGNVKTVPNQAPEETKLEDTTPKDTTPEDTTEQQQETETLEEESPEVTSETEDSTSNTEKSSLEEDLAKIEKIFGKRRKKK